MIDTVHICVAMKPIEGNFAQNALEHGVAGLNIDECRIESMVLESERRTSKPGGGRGGMFMPNGDMPAGERHNPSGRWPANVLHDGSDEVTGQFPVLTSRSTASIDGRPKGTTFGGSKMDDKIKGKWFGDTGSASRFFQTCEPDDENTQ